ncbi:MCM DNA helicase complex subunit mcm6 [Trifolium repens]|nr:DNA replication licensing factor MCM6 [Trifolium repens]WJX23694.1 MCM DNA helicase complex subunit mcm6 [Trifolium repens]
MKLHQKHDDALDPAFSTAEVKCYVANAKTLKPKVQPHHVDEAEKMLKTSIISVKSSEIDLSDFQELNWEDATGNGD